MDVVANNLANINSTRTAEGGPYRRQTVLLRAEGGASSFAILLSGRREAPGGGSADAVVDDPTPPRRVHDLGHPDADAEGYVLYPAIDVSLEMTDMISANHSCQANVTALNVLKGMAQKALEIGR